MTKTCKGCAREMDREQFRAYVKDGVRCLRARCRQCEAAEAGERWHANRKLKLAAGARPWSPEEIAAMELAGAAKTWRGPVNDGPLVATIGRIAA